MALSASAVYLVGSPGQSCERLAREKALAALGQGRVASAACEALGRNPAARTGIQVALILGLAFIESLVLFTLVIIFVKVA